MSSRGTDKNAQTQAETLFAQVLQLFPARHDDNEAITEESPIFDLSSGLAARFCQVCKDRLDSLNESQIAPSDPTTLWQLEHNTWDLIADLYL